MARISVEDCLKRVANRFALVTLASARTKQLYKGSAPRVQADNKEIVLALREIAAGKVTPAHPLQENLISESDPAPQLEEEKEE